MLKFISRSMSTLMIVGFAMATAIPALAATCQYGGGGATDSGPCIQFGNEFNRNYDLYCQQGYTSTTHKIVINNGDSFTCKVNDADAVVAKTIYQRRSETVGTWSDWSFNCDGNKLFIKLNSSETWSWSCED